MKENLGDMYLIALPYRTIYIQDIDESPIYPSMVITYRMRDVYKNFSSCKAFSGDYFYFLR